MSSSRQRQLRREQQQLKRRRAAKEPMARETQRQQAEAVARQNLEQQHRRHVAAYVMFALAAFIAVGHLFEHSGTIELMSPGLQDLLIGWPTAAAIAVTGAVVYGR